MHAIVAVVATLLSGSVVWLWLYYWLWPTTSVEYGYYAVFLFQVGIHILVRFMYAANTNSQRFWVALSIHAISLVISHWVWYNQERLGIALLLYDVLLVGSGLGFPQVDGGNAWVLANASERSMTQNRRLLLALVYAGVGGWNR